MSALDDFMIHDDRCNIHYSGHQDCTCGLDAAVVELADLRTRIAELEKAVEEAEKIFTNSEYLEISGYCRVKIFDVNDWVFAYGKEKRNDGISEV